MMQGMLIKALGICSLLVATGAWAGQVTKLDLKTGKDAATLTVVHAGEGKFRLFKSEKQGNVIIEAEDLSLPPALTKMIDVSAKEGPVLQMTPYNSTHGAKAMAKLVVQLRQGADVTSNDLPGRFVVEIKRKPGTASYLPAIFSKESAKLLHSDELKERQAAAKKSEEVARRLIEVLNSPDEEKKYFGSKVTFEAKDAEVPDIFRLVGESSDLNIIWDTDVEGQKTSLAVKDLPWDQLLDIVIQQKGYRAAVMGNVVRIMTLDTFNKQAEAKKKEISLSDELEPVIMAVIPLGFIPAADMKSLISSLIQERTTSSSAATAGVASASGGSVATAAGEIGRLGQDFKRGRIEVESRTNSLVVTNTKDSIERIRRLVKELDVPVPQVLIDAKVIVANETFSKNIGVSWKQHTYTESGAGGAGGTFNGQGDVKFPLDTDDAGKFTISSAAGTSSFGVGLGATSRSQIFAKIDLAEINGQSKTIASPRLIVNNNSPANIIDGTTITVPVSGGTGAAGSFKDIIAALSLTVTPQVTSHGSVQLKNLTVTKNAVGTPVNGNVSVNNKSIVTDVLVDSGATLVLGGVFQAESQATVAGIPLLKDLPFIGQLFRTDSKSSTKSELMVFITPQILDPEAPSQTL